MTAAVHPAIAAFLKQHDLPLPSLDAVNANEISLSTADGCHKFVVPAEAAKSASGFIRGILADAEDVCELPVGAEVATVPALSLVASWLRSPSSCLAEAEEVVPRPDVSQNPGTAGNFGERTIQALMTDCWVRSTLWAVFPPLSVSYALSSNEVRGESRPDPQVCPMTFITGVSGLALLHSTAVLASFLQFGRLALLCSAYMLNWMKEAIRDERAFAVQHRIRESLAHASSARSKHSAVRMIEESMLTPPAGWDAAAAPLIEHFACCRDISCRRDGAEEDIHDMVLWLRDACTNMKV